MAKAEREGQGSGEGVQPRPEDERLVLKAHLRGPQLNSSDPNQVGKHSFVRFLIWTNCTAFSKCWNPMRNRMTMKWHS